MRYDMIDLTIYQDFDCLFQTVNASRILLKSALHFKTLGYKNQPQK